MNDKGREALVAAALNGVKQIRFRWSDGHGGLCAQGVLVKDYGFELSFKEMNITQAEYETITDVVCREYDLAGGEWYELAELNDANDQKDFLTIARKVGVKEER